MQITTKHARLPWRSRLRPGITMGCDYNPEQWPQEVWIEDARLMQEAGVDLVSLGIFAWALLEPSPGTYRLDWLAQVMDLLHEHDVRVALATATASPPPWLAHRHPEMLPELADGSRLWPGGRQAFCPSSPVYREHALRLVDVLARRFGDHPSVALWHVGNELGCHNAHCYCDRSAAAFREWLRSRYGTIEALNEAWGTQFWSQRYGSFDEVLPPRQVAAIPNPTQQLDFRRFSSDELLHNYTLERDLLRKLTPQIPATTNLMVGNHTKNQDYLGWGAELDVVANDHYVDAADPEGHIALAFSADLTRGVARGEPWLLMEHSTSAVNWQSRNRAKAPGELTRNSLAHMARGADGVMFFQWRASRAGAEKFHSALVPHAGTDTKVWREVVQLGQTLDRLNDVVGSTVAADVAIVFDYHAWWAAELESHPSVDVRYTDRALAHYRALWNRGVAVDFVPPEEDLTAYRLVIVPTLYLATDAAAANLASFVGAGGTALVTYFSGIVDENDHVRLGGYPGAFRELLGVQVEEFFPLLAGERVRLDGGATADVWTELLHLRGAEAIDRYADGVLAGVPAVTRNRAGGGTAWYAATRMDDDGVASLTDRLIEESGVTPVTITRPGVEVVRRLGQDAEYVFIINHTSSSAELDLAGDALVGPTPVDGRLVVAAGEVAVIRHRPRAGSDPGSG